MSASRHSRCEFDAIVVVGSQGAMRATAEILERLPEGFETPIVVDLHRPAGTDYLESLLEPHSRLPVCSAGEGDRLCPGRVYVGPADRQLLIAGDGSLALRPRPSVGPRRWSPDLLLESAARVLGRGVIATVLTGRLDGAANGVRAVKHAGGRVLVQDPATASAPAMPNAALATGCVDHALPVAKIGDALTVLCSVEGGAELLRVRLHPLASRAWQPVAAAIGG